MSIKTVFSVYTGPIIGPGWARHPIPPLQGYSQGVLLVRVKNKAIDGDIGIALAEFTEPGIDEAWRVEEIIVPIPDVEYEWRLVVSLPAIHYELQTNMYASAADIEATLIAS